MNSENQIDSDGETSRPPEESSSPTSNHHQVQKGQITSTSSSSITPTSSTGHTSTTVTETEEMKRAAVKKLIERYFYQLLEGCGNPKCENKYCASSGAVPTLTPNQAAARALQLFSQEAKLCPVTTQPPKIPQNQMDVDENIDISSNNSENSINSRNHLINPSSGYSRITHLEPHSSNTSQSNVARTDEYLDEQKIDNIIRICIEHESPLYLIRSIGAVFSSPESIALSFQKKAMAPIDVLLKKAPRDLRSLTKEDLRALEGDLDKDEDSCADKEITPESHHINVDFNSLRRSMRQLFSIEPNIDDDDDISGTGDKIREQENLPKNPYPVYEPFNNALQSLASCLSINLQLTSEKTKIEEIITVFVIIFDIICVAPSEFLDVGLSKICYAASHLPVWAQGRLAWIWSKHCRNEMKILLASLQQMITLQVVQVSVQENETICNATRVMKILYYANILAGEIDWPRLREEDLDTSALSLIPEDEPMGTFSSNSSKPKSAILEDKLAIELDISAMDSREPFIPFSEFYNEYLSDTIEMDNDYLNYKNISMDDKRIFKKFCFMLYSFILTPATKTLALYYDSRIRMYSERRISIFNTQLAGQPPNPYLKLKIRRDHIIDDALIELEMIAMGNPKDLKKQLVVEFVGEQGIDEGGVSKEFFQLIVEQIFNPDYGMFINQEDTETVWFNSTSFENEAQFTLIGIVLGLAIYNNIILAVNFPMVVYRKLMGIKGSFEDLKDWNPNIYNSLMSMLKDDESDMEEVYMQTFEISYKDVFGNTLHHELKPNGKSIFVTQDNKTEFINLYVDYLLNISIDKQFRAFRKGFQMVTDESPLQLLFRPDEIELLVCGSKRFDLTELQKATDYEGGYTSKSQIIKDFWNIIHSLPVESQRKFLEFTTGSDRVPVGGLSRLKMVIARNGPDCDRLPTSHTCFNVLLLPEYNSKEKLKERLLKAINYSKGFGML